MSTEAEKKAVRKYQAKCKEVRIKYTEKEISEYNMHKNIYVGTYKTVIILLKNT